jgi:predicted YcjX-like family ATPase
MERGLSAASDIVWLMPLFTTNRTQKILNSNSSPQSEKKLRQYNYGRMFEILEQSTILNTSCYYYWSRIRVSEIVT